MVQLITRTPRRTDNDDIELETTLQELVFDLLSDGVETNVGRSADFIDCNSGHLRQGRLFKGEEKWGAKESSRVEQVKLWRQICLLVSGSNTKTRPALLTLPRKYILSAI